jgi:hypothetical protein
LWLFSTSLMGQDEICVASEESKSKNNGDEAGLLRR